MDAKAALDSTIVAPIVSVRGDAANGEQTKTADQSDEPALPLPVPHRLAAPLQKRDPDRYEILGEHGRGGLGTVLRANDKELGRHVAIKELIKRGDVGEVRFLREAMITARLEHPGIVPVHEAGQWPDGTPFYVMKLVAGRSLKQLIASTNSVDERLRLLDHVIAVAEAVAYAHKRDIIHRDLKPANVIVGDFGETVVIDWGLAKDLSEADDQIEGGPFRTPAQGDLTETGSVLGTPSYMAPEQWRGERVDHRADVFAIGAMLWELCSTHRVPPNDISQRDRILRRSRVPTDLVAIISRALAVNPGDRYRDAGELATDLKAFSNGRRIASRHYSWFAIVALAFSRHRAISLVVMAALVALTATFAIALVNIREERGQALAAHQTAVINSAAAMLERDPTRAWETLRSIPSHGAPALLRARIQAAGVADRTVKLPGRFDKDQVIAAGERVVLSTGERTLHVLDTRTGNLRLLAEGLTEPAIWSATEERVYFVRQTSHLAVAEVPVDGGPVVEIATLRTLPRYMFANDHGAFWLASDRTVNRVIRGEPARVFARDVEEFMVFGSEIVTCTKQHEMLLGDIDKTPRVIGVCEPDGAWNMVANGFIHASANTFYVYAAGALRSWPVSAEHAMKYALLTETGLVAGIGTNGDGLVRRPGAGSIEHVRLTAAPRIVAAHGSVAGWSFADGSIQVLDAVDGRQWSIHATPG
ncbi:MAG: serine/threonine-protein kinase, partial [Kofleriaceae bacterium]